jgi:hypothetical protein
MILLPPSEICWMMVKMWYNEICYTVPLKTI